MAEYIDREMLLKELNHFAFNEYNVVVNDLICRQPVVDVASVVHGRWVTHYRSGTPVAEEYVSTCCDMWNNRKSDYCPNCGAKMDGGADHEDDKC